MNACVRRIIVLGIFGLWVVVCCVLFQTQAVGQETGSTLVLATFDECMRPTEYVQDWGAYEEKATAKVNCVTLSSPNTGQAIRMTYNVLNYGSYCGFWMKWEVPEFNPTKWDHVSFRIRGDTTGATRRVKVELKIKESSWGWKVYYLENITTAWQTISIPLNDFIDPPWGKAGWYEIDQFVITFENEQVTKRTGTIYIDDIALTSGNPPSPTAAFTWDPLHPVVGESITFNASSSSALAGRIVKYEWDWNSDGTYDYSTTKPVTEYLFSTPGSHQVTLRVTSDKGATATAAQIVAISEPPIAAFTFSPSSPSILDTVEFTDKSSDPDGEIKTWKWEFGDGETSSERNPTHRYREKGTFTVKLTVTDNDGLTDATTQQMTVINIPPNALFTTNPSRALIDWEVTFDASGTSDPDGTIVKYEWDFGDITTGNGKVATHKFSTPGTYAVKLTVTDDDGATASIESEVKVFRYGGEGGPA